MTAKEIAIQLANVAIKTASNQDLTGEEKEKQVINFLVKLDDTVPIAGLIPNKLEADLASLGIDKLKEFLSQIDIKSFVKKQYNRIKHVL